MTETEEKHVDLKTKIAGLIDERNKHSDNVKILLQKIKDEKAKRDEENTHVTELKGQRDKLTNRLRTIGNRLQEIGYVEIDDEEPLGLLKREFNELNWKYQTGVCSVAKEKEIVKELDRLEEKIEKRKDASKLLREKRGLQHELKDVKAQAKQFHEELLKHADESEKHHQEMVATYKKVDALQQEIKKIVTELSELKGEAADAREKYLKEIDSERAKQDAERKKEEDEHKKSLKKQADAIMSDFKSGKKLTFEDMAVIREADD